MQDMQHMYYVHSANSRMDSNCFHDKTDYEGVDVAQKILAGSSWMSWNPLKSGVKQQMHMARKQQNASAGRSSWPRERTHQQPKSRQEHWTCWAQHWCPRLCRWPQRVPSRLPHHSPHAQMTSRMQSRPAQGTEGQTAGSLSTCIQEPESWTQPFMSLRSACQNLLEQQSKWSGCESAYHGFQHHKTSCHSPWVDVEPDCRAIMHACLMFMSC